MADTFSPVDSTTTIVIVAAPDGQVTVTDEGASVSQILRPLQVGYVMSMPRRSGCLP